MPENFDEDLIVLTIDVVSSYVGQNGIAMDAVPAFITSTYAAIKALKEPAPAAKSEQSVFTPAVSVRKSLAKPDHILSMIDGKPYKTLRRHISGHGLTVEEYRQRYHLPHDYPMVAKTYSELRRALAGKIGLGRKPKAATVQASATADTSRQGAKPKPNPKPRPTGTEALKRSRDLLKIRTNPTGG